MEQRVGDNLGGYNSPHHQRPYDNVSTYGYHDMPVQHSHPIHDIGYQGRPQHKGGRRGGLGGKGYHRPQEEYPKQEVWHDDNSYEDFGDNPHVGQAYHGGYYGNQQGDKALDKIKWKLPSFKSDSDPNDHSKHKMEEKGKLITDPTKCFKCNGVGHIAINCPIKRTLVFNEDLNGWIEKSDDEYQEGIVNKDEISEDLVKIKILPLLKPKKRE
ncbi:hypothetical protein M9H77_06842 [Catharanthus roseus]|uniref:Uncharacterized protein n=1 Tax=Catharanthus roseus TaxID=4058 RepID=A0ACC0BT83_CATRO|nr:hypothetical protein M9H77_06842 [Catharanthus roseus]